MLGSGSHRSKFLAAKLIGGLTMIATVQSAHAAVLSLESVTRVAATPSTAADLTSVGTLDWAYWNSIGTSLANPLAPTNEKVGGTIIGSLRTDDGMGNLRGSSSTVAQTYSWTDGTSPATGASTSLALTFNNLIGSNNLNKGIGISLPGSTSADRYAFLYFGGFAATGRLTLSLPGAIPVIYDTPAYGAGPKGNDIFVVRYRPDNPADQLSANFIMTSTTDATNGHVGAQAVAISNVPEPTSLGMLVAGGMLTLRRRRRTL
jgi:hypothetical protein